MIILISPAKSLDFNSTATGIGHSDIIFGDDTTYLVGKLQKKSAGQLKQMMGVSDALAELNVERFQNWKESYVEPDAKQAALAFDGDVYKGMKFAELDSKEMDFAQDHLRILSGIYGVLRPLDMIQPYRLEMGTKWAITPKKTNLYKYWDNRLTDYINSEIERTGSTFVLNLASNEYSKVIKFKDLKVPVISPEFREEKGDRFQMISFFAKRARGMMAAFAIKKEVQNKNSLVKFETEGYTYNEALSNKESNKWVFTRKSE